MEAISPELVLVAPAEEAARARALLPPLAIWAVDAQRIRPLAPPRPAVPRPLFVAAVVSNLLAIALGLFVSPRAAHSSPTPARPAAQASRPSIAERDLAALQSVAEPRVEPPGRFRIGATPR